MNDGTANLISDAARTIVQQAQALGLTWTLRIATVVTSSINGNATIVFDGDTVTISATNLTGSPFGGGSRVYCIMVPQSGNFIIGAAQLTALAYGCNSVQAMSAGSTVSAVYVALPGSPGVTINKVYDNTNLRFSMNLSFFTTGSSATTLFAVLSGSFQVAICKLTTPNGALNSHTSIGGSGSLPNVPAGSKTWTGAWALGAGGTPNVDAGDYWTMCVEEYWP